MRPRRDLRPYALLLVAAAARLAMTMAALPPYAGLDEPYHVARLEFVMQEHRNPTTTEKSVPAYLAPVLDLRTHVVPATAQTKPYLVPNYEAQQPVAYYSLVAPLGRLVPHTPMNVLRVWRIVSFALAIICVVAVASIGAKWAGAAGIAAAALVPFLPTWETLVMRASNDAMACALVACAIAMTVRKTSVIAEALLWAAAIATKLYTWPLAIVVPLLWRRQRATRTRVIAVTAAAIASAIATVADLTHRTRNPIGVVVIEGAKRASVSIAEIVKVTIASAAWTSGGHFDALRPAAIALYVLPVVAALWLARKNISAFSLLLSALSIGAFAAAQTTNVIICITKSAAQIGGKEGWYWYVLAPILVPALLAPAIAKNRWLSWWLVAWDIVITDVQLIPTWSGLTSPLHPSLLFRWGPMHLPPAWVIPFRIVQIAALALVVRRA